MGAAQSHGLTPQKLPDPALMALFDRAEGAPLAERRLALAAAFLPGDADVPSLGVGDAERLFWHAKCALFGPRAPAQFACDGCGEMIGFAVPEGFDLPARVAPVARVAYNGVTYEIACPTLEGLGQGGVAALCPDAPWSDPAFRAKAAEALDAADPAIDVVFDVTCADCGAENPRAFDAAAFLWADLEAFAAGVFAQVAILARAFGWSEAETLALSPARRARYVGMVT
ncbi:hypothetical protein [Flavimaricola marinus]|uniref:Phage baseplate protein n=1 Tax=Flavimaricola marinus TaxID=1819565 RepID=A0A238L9J3_9RHOB|nr:hypothetical protein [Flavimaricola marinus]SMY06271.1 hypothetical protein LOM8899_00394 [Flavimaricola marinus]